MSKGLPGDVLGPLILFLLIFIAPAYVVGYTGFSFWLPRIVGYFIWVAIFGITVLGTPVAIIKLAERYWPVPEGDSAN